MTAAVGALRLILIAAAAPARAAFDLRQAVPEALGAVSSDLAFDPLEDRPPGAGGAIAEGSHASLFGVPGLAADRVAVGWRRAGGDVVAVWSRAGTPDLAEVEHSLAWTERGGRRVLLRARAERLALRLAGEPEAAGWAVGGGVAARLARRVEVVVESDRALRSTGAERLGAAPALVAAVRWSAGPFTVAAADRWERTGRRSPRLSVLVPVGSALRLRAGRGHGPGRIGLALGVRWGRIEVAAGRLDGAGGGTVSSVGVRLLARPEPYLRRPARP